MTSLINPGNLHFKDRKYHASVVPAAAVWEPRSAHSQLGRSGAMKHFEASKQGVRTLGFEHISSSFPRVDMRVEDIHEHNKTSSVDGNEEHTLGAYILGGIFGFVIFAGTLLGSAIAEDSVTPAPVISQSAQNEAPLQLR